MTRLTTRYLEDMLAQLEAVGVSRDQAIRHLSNDLHRKTHESLPRLLMLTNAKNAANAFVDRLTDELTS